MFCRSVRIGKGSAPYTSMLSTSVSRAGRNPRHSYRSFHPRASLLAVMPAFGVNGYGVGVPVAVGVDGGVAVDPPL
jgi:hypothetical protein